MSRNYKELKALDKLRRDSVNAYPLNGLTLIFDDKNKREFFRYVNGGLEEYDCTRYKGQILKYSREENDSIRELGLANLRSEQRQ